jgi:hypothetical protein
VKFRIPNRNTSRMEKTAKLKQHFRLRSCQQLNIDRKSACCIQSAGIRTVTVRPQTLRWNPKGRWACLARCGGLLAIGGTTLLLFSWYKCICRIPRSDHLLVYGQYRGQTPDKTADIELLHNPNSGTVWRPKRVNTMATPNRNYKFYKPITEFPFIRLDKLKFVASAKKYFI